MYHKLIIEHDRAPYHYEKRESADQVIEAYNPLCGDKYKLYLQMEEEVIQTAYFHGYGCAISKASTSILVKKIEGLTIATALELCKQFFAQLESNHSEATPDPDFEAFTTVRKFPGRMKCVSLSWDAFTKKHS